MTVGDYLATPSRSSFIRRAADGCAVLFLCLWAGAVALVVLSDDWGIGEDLARPVAYLLASNSLTAGLMVSSLVALTACVALRILDSFDLAVSRDKLGGVKRALLRVMLERSRFGISPQTPLESVGLSVHHLYSGAGVGGVRCRNRCAPFMPEDLKGVAAADFGGIDFICIGGDLLVFFSVDAKKGFIKATSKKKGSVHK